MILTVTLNPALDLTYEVDTLVPRGEHRVAEVHQRPGGKGVNVARILAALGESVTVTGLAGGATGTAVRAALPGCGVTDAFMEIGGETRRTVVVAEPATATGFWEPGPEVTAAEWDAFLAHHRTLVSTVDAVIMPLTWTFALMLVGDVMLVLIGCLLTIRSWAWAWGLLPWWGPPP